MKLFPRLGQSSVITDDATYELGEDGTVEVPEPLGLSLHATHIGGMQAWETHAERHFRTIEEERERRRDPAALYELMERAQRAPEDGSDPVDVDAAVKAAVEAALAKAAQSQQAAIDAAVKAALARQPAKAAAKKAGPKAPSVS